MEIVFSWGALSALLIAISGIPYMWGIYKRSIPRPVLSTWGIWAVLGLLLLVAYYEAGARNDTTLLAAWMGFINPVIIFILALKYGEFRWTRLETMCVIFCMVSIVVWKTTGNPLLGLLGGLLADAMGIIPQIRHVVKSPADEPLFPWGLFCIGSAVNLLGIQEWTLAQYVYPVYMTAGSLLLVLPLLAYRMKSLK